MKSPPFIAACIATCIAATPVFAECPTAEDLDTGIRIIESDGLTSILTRKNDGVVEQIGKLPDGFTFRTLMAQGIHVLQLADMENGRVLRDTVANTAYPDTAADLPVPTVDLTWEVATVVSYLDGYNFAETQTQVWGDTIDWTVGECTFSAIQGEITYVSVDNEIVEGIYYLPELGISYLHSYSDNAGGPDRYEALRIEAVR